MQVVDQKCGIFRYAIIAIFVYSVIMVISVQVFLS
jgi:hypothetical protein